MIKKLLTLSLFCSATSLFGFGFYVGQWGEKQPENGFKTSTCNWGRSLHYTTDLFKMKPGISDSIAVRGGQVVELDQNLNIGGLTSVVGKLVYAKGKNIKLRENINTELQTSKISFENCTLEVGKHLQFNYWHKSRRGGISTVEFIDTKANINGCIFCIVPVHPDVDFKNAAGPNIVLKGKSQVSFGTGVVIDEIFNEKPSTWKFTFKFVITDSVPALVLDNEVKAKGITFEFDTNSFKVAKAGIYPLLTLVERDSNFTNSKFILNGQPYTLGNSFTAGGKSVKIEMAPSPLGKDTKTANDIVLVISK